MRSEEEMSLDIAIYEKKSTAREKLAVFARKQKIGRRITVCAAAASLAALAVPMLRAYDAERVSLLLILFASWIVFAAVVRIACGSLLCRSLAAYFRWSRLAAKFPTAEEVMKKTEELFAEGTLFENDLKKAEDELVSLAEKINSMPTLR